MRVAMVGKKKSCDMVSAGEAEEKRLYGNRPGMRPWAARKRGDKVLFLGGKGKKTTVREARPAVFI